MIVPVLPDVPRPDSEILHLLQRVIDIGRHRGTFTTHDVTRVLEDQQAGISPVTVLPAPGRTVTAWRTPRHLGRPREVSLTQTQGEILTALCDGLSNAEIAQQRGIPEITVKTHVRRVLVALDAPGDRTRAVADVLTGRVQVWIRPPRGTE